MRKVILTKPFSLETDNEEVHDDNGGENYSVPNLLQRIFALFSHVRPGSDLSNFQACFPLYFSQLYIHSDRKNLSKLKTI